MDSEYVLLKVGNAMRAETSEGSDVKSIGCTHRAPTESGLRQPKSRISASCSFPNSSSGTIVKLDVLPTVPMLKASPESLLPVARPGRTTKELKTAVFTSGIQLNDEAGMGISVT